LLKDAGFEFEVSKERKSEALKQMDRSWDEFFAELKQYKEKYGQISDIKQRKKKTLREWCDEQRVQHAKKSWGKVSKISEEQIEKLQNIGFVWTATETPSKGWDDYYCDLLSNYIKTSTFDIPDENIELKQWVEIQKTECKKYISGIPSFLTYSQVKKLRDASFPLGIVSVTEETKGSWEEMFSQLLLFKIQNKTYDVPESMKELLLWTCEQRRQKMEEDKRKSKSRSAIWEERMRRLTNVRFNWNGKRFVCGVGQPQKQQHEVLPTETTNTNRETRVAILPVNTTTMNFSGWPNTSMPFLSHQSGQAVLTVHHKIHHNASNGAAGKDLATQAAMIVRDINSRSNNDNNNIDMAITDTDVAVLNSSIPATKLNHPVDLHLLHIPTQLVPNLSESKNDSMKKQVDEQPA